MFELTQNGNTIAYDTMTIKEGIDVYSSEVLVDTKFIIDPKQVVLLKFADKVVRLKTMSQASMVGISSYTLYSENYVNMISKVFKPINKVCSFPDMCSIVGIEAALESVRTNVSNWQYPSYSIRTLLDKLFNNISVPNGGGACGYINLEGKLVLVDLLTVSKSRPTGSFIGTITNQQYSVDWQNSYPGIVDCYFYTEKGLNKQTLNLMDGYGRGLYRLYTSEDSISQAINLLTNDFYWHYFNSTTVTMDNCVADKVSVGRKITSKDLNLDFIIKSVVMSVKNKEIANVNFTLINKP